MAFPDSRTAWDGMRGRRFFSDTFDGDVADGKREVA